MDIRILCFPLFRYIVVVAIAVVNYFSPFSRMNMQSVSIVSHPKTNLKKVKGPSFRTNVLKAVIFLTIVSLRAMLILTCTVYAGFQYGLQYSPILYDVTGAMRSNLPIYCMGLLLFLHCWKLLQVIVFALWECSIFHKEPYRIRRRSTARYKRRSTLAQPDAGKLEKASMKNKRFGTRLLYYLRDAQICGSEFYSLLFAVRMVAIPFQTYQAYKMSRYIPEIAPVAMAGMILSFECIFQPSLFFSKRMSPYVRRCIALYVDTSTTALLGMMNLLFLLLPLVGDLMGDLRLMGDFEWGAVAIYRIQQLVIRSPFDLLSKMFPIILSHFNLKETWVVVQEEGYLEDFEMPKEKKKPRRATVLAVISLMWGITFGSAMVATWVRLASPTTCTETCHYRVQPWFTSDCHCIALGVDCRKFPNYQFQDLDALPTTLTYLRIDYCPFPEIPHSLERLEDITVLEVKSVQATSWKPRMKAFKLLLTVYLRDLPLKVLPSEFYELPSSMASVMLRSLNFQKLPWEIEMGWKDLNTLSLTGHNFTSFPMVITKLSKMATLKMQSCNLSGIPNNISNLVELSEALFNDNQIAYLPPQLVSIPTLNVLALGDNNISAFPIEFDFLRLNSMEDFTIGNNPLCQQVQYKDKKFCEPDCAPGCEKASIGNYFCRPICNVSACNFDGNDCLLQAK